LEEEDHHPFLLIHEEFILTRMELASLLMKK
jgi:hypothetical protein